MKHGSTLIVLIALLFVRTEFAQPRSVGFWLTKTDGSVLLEQQRAKVIFEKGNENLPTITVDDGRRFQTMDGFGYTLTGGSAYVINRLSPKAKTSLLKELFGKGKGSIGVSYLRISIGASDLNVAAFSYNDLPPGETDPELSKFSLGIDAVELVPLLREILRINPRVKILGSPWSAPPWMKDNGSFVGGSLQRKYYGVYARYFVRYLTEMRRLGIRLDAITPQNEPLHPGNEPSMLMSAAEQADFIANHLGPAFAAAKLQTKIIIYDHNCDKPEYPIEVLRNKAAREFIDGSAFHLYAGEIGCLSRVKEAFPEKNVYFTEQYTSSKGTFADDYAWHIRNLVIGAPRNWSKTVLEWNLANDADFKPFTPGGCSVCKGALTIDKNTVTRNVGFYIIAQASKFVPPGSVRIATAGGDISNVAFLTPDGKLVLITLNEGENEARFFIGYNDKKALVTLPAGSAGTFIWKQ